MERLWRSVKYEDVYLKGYTSVSELLLGLTEYFVFYNRERKHQSLGYDTPDEVYRTGVGGGARIVDKYSEVEKIRLEKREKVEIETKSKTEGQNRGSAVRLHVKGDHLKLDTLLS